MSLSLSEIVSAPAVLTSAFNRFSEHLPNPSNLSMAVAIEQYSRCSSHWLVEPTAMVGKGHELA